MLTKTLVVRSYATQDIEQLIAIQRDCFPPPYPAEQLWNEKQLRNHIEIFPEGALCVAAGDALIASATALIIAWQPSDPAHSWAEVTDNGYITTHNPQGNTLYGVDIAVRPSWRNQGIARLLYQARYELVKKLNLVRFIAGGRIPGYYQHRHTLSPEEYVQQVIARKLTDPVITPQLRAGLQPLQLIHDYLPDEESANCALLLEWSNPHHFTSASD